METRQALFDAIRRGDAAEADRLLDADPALAEARGDDGSSPLMTALGCGAAEIVAALLARGATPDLFAAAALGDAARVEAIAAAEPGAVRGRSHDGWTALHLAAFFGQPRTVGALLRLGAEVDARSDNATANTPLHAALAGREEAEVIGLLLRHGADVRAQGGGGVTPLHLAAARGNREGAGELLRLGADPAARTDDGADPAELAAQRGHPALAGWLRERAAAPAADAR